MFSADKAQEALIMLLYYMETILIGAAWCNKATALAQGQKEAESFSGKLLLEAFFVASFPENHLCLHSWLSGQLHPFSFGICNQTSNLKTLKI